MALPASIPWTNAHNVEWARAGRRELLALGAYFALVVAITDIFNIRLGVELLTLVVLVAAAAISRQLRLFLRDWWFALVGLVMWNLSGPVAANSTVAPHLDLMMQADRLLLFGRDPVSVVQLSLAGPQVGWLDIVTGIIYNMHLAEPYIAGYFLWRLNRAVYLQFITSVLILLVLGFVTFILFPAIPPWMAAADYGKVPGIQNLFGRVLRWHPMPFHGTPIFYFFKFRGDAVAAMPSEHAAFPVLELLAFYRVSRRVAVFLALWVAAVLFAVLFLGMHWAVDALVGWMYAFVIFTFVRWFARRG